MQIKIFLALAIIFSTFSVESKAQGASEQQWKKLLWETTLSTKEKMALDKFYDQLPQDSRNEMYKTFQRDIRAQNDIVKEGFRKLLRGDFSN